MEKLLGGTVYAVALATFDEAVGNTLTATYPVLQLNDLFTAGNVYDLCFPDGCHSFNEDLVPLILHFKDPAGLPSPIIFGVAAYACREDASYTRGAHMCSLLLLSWAPMFYALQDLARHAVHRYLVGEEPYAESFVEKIYHGINGTMPNPCLTPIGPTSAEQLFLPWQQTNSSAITMEQASGENYILIDTDAADDVPGTPVVQSFCFSAEDTAMSPRELSESAPAKTPSDGDTDSTVTSRNNSITLATTGPFPSAKTDPIDVQCNEVHLLATSVPMETTEPPATPELFKPPSQNRLAPASPGLAPQSRRSSRSTEDAMELEVPQIVCTLWGTSFPLALPTAANVLDQLGFGSRLGLLVDLFHEDVISIWHCLLNRKPVIFVGQPAAIVGECCLACTHLVAPLHLELDEVLPFVPLSQAHLIEDKPFYVMGTTSMYFWERREYGYLLCNTELGKVETVGKETLKPTREDKSFMQYTLTKAKEGRGEAWIRKMFMCNTQRALLEVWEESARRIKAMPVLQAHYFPLFQELAVSKDALRLKMKSDDMAEGKVSAAYSYTTTKLKKLLDQTAVILEALRPAFQRSECAQRDMYDAIQQQYENTRAQLFNAASVTTDGSGLHGSRGASDLTVLCEMPRLDQLITQQQKHNEREAERLVTEIKERIFLLIDGLNSQNDNALHDEINQEFADLFNTFENDIYNLPSQVVIDSFPCTFVRRRGDDLEGGAQVSTGSEGERGHDSLPVSGKMYLTKHYLCFHVNWLSRYTNVFSHARLEVISLDDVALLERCNTLMLSANAIRLVLIDGRDVFIGGLQHMERVFLLLSTLYDKQHRFLAFHRQMEMSGHQLCNFAGKRAPAGLYPTKDARVLEEVWENQRKFPLLGWTAKMLPTDRPSWSDKSGFRRRTPAEVPLPNEEDWEWCGPWAAASAYEYAVNFDARDWHGTPTAFDMTRRRRWIRARHLKPEAMARRSIR
eukprot:TRINITY_DN12013_c0_g1_i1.p1 TRINITY_DN12013_c0_g1~~TRINITY_DN12013_c0_g1_i1.p1  ORF type:complete len:977 (-),score=162.38 TRINITY_DN12013_c0_g1_i1:1128-4028(-)